MELFLFGTFWFWVLALVAFVLITTYVNFDDGNGYLASAIVVISLISFFTFGNLNILLKILKFIQTEPLLTVTYIFSYIGIGALWSMIKWFTFLIDKKNEILENRIKYPNIHGNNKIEIPLAKNYKSDIILWMSYWHVSILWTLIHKWIGKIWSNIYNRLGFLYNQISKYVFKDFPESDIESNEK